MIKNIALVIGGLWIFQHLARAHDTANRTSELHPSDPYSSITTGWDILNGYGLGENGTGYNAHKPFFTASVGMEPGVKNPCVCHG